MSMRHLREMALNAALKCTELCLSNYLTGMPGLSNYRFAFYSSLPQCAIIVGGEELRKQVGAVAYIECDSKTQQHFSYKKNHSIKEGIYDEYVTETKDQVNVFMFGDGANNTIITGNRNHKTDWTTFKSATFHRVAIAELKDLQSKLKVIEKAVIELLMFIEQEKLGTYARLDSNEAKRSFN
ncbi:hypothetical protein CTI12_AA461520 [Artemisia annua]|uniref:Pectinesterase catalytic domain-containing protein n=1 Tax=Artemisia annua TaxID=35608 RepID=A0A2U1LRT5_ARTAN|nr:hypothetical protein CTI12_AA461520 [Artemisia annua]